LKPLRYLLRISVVRCQWDGGGSMSPNAAILPRSAPSLTRPSEATSKDGPPFGGCIGHFRNRPPLARGHGICSSPPMLFLWTTIMNHIIPSRKRWPGRAWRVSRPQTSSLGARISVADQDGITAHLHFSPEGGARSPMQETGTVRRIRCQRNDGDDHNNQRCQRNEISHAT
jgi:hypothetical protein